MYSVGADDSDPDPDRFDGICRLGDDRSSKPVAKMMIVLLLRQNALQAAKGARPKKFCIYPHANLFIDKYVTLNASFAVAVQASTGRPG